MSRFYLVLSFAVIASLISGIPVQGQASTTLAPPDAILRLQEDSSWTFWRDATGAPMVVDNHQMHDGVPLVELNPTTRQHYEEHQVQDVFAYYAELVPVSYYYEAVATSVQTRVIRFPDATYAEGYLNSVMDAQMQAIAGGEIEDRQFTPVEPLPEFPNPIVGWTSVSSFQDVETGEVSGYASGVRYHAQIDNIIVSAEVVGPFVDFNFDLAYWLLENQAYCVQQDSPCAPTTVPMGSGDWFLIGDVLYFGGVESGEGVEARWIFPVEDPILKPELSGTLSPP